MRYGNYKSTNLEGCATFRDWLNMKADEATLTYPKNTEIVFILPYVGTRLTTKTGPRLDRLIKKVSKCSGFGPGATRNAIRRAAT